jgi:HEAT repeats
MTSRHTRKALGALFVLVLLLVSAAAQGDSRVDFLSERLHSDDFRVRTNAALALGATNDDAAVSPLCGALSDSNDVVRRAAVEALKRLSRSSSLDCLRRRASVEPSGSIKSQIQRAIESIDSGGGGAGGSSGNGGPPPLVANAKFYVSISPVTNNTTRPTGEIDQIVEDAIKGKLSSLGGYQLAPGGEAPDAARATISKRRLKGYYLSVAVEKFDYSDNDLRVRIKIAVFSYPGKDLRGEVPAGATMSGTSPGNKSAEDQLMRAVAESATEKFAQNFR